MQIAVIYIYPQVKMRIYYPLAKRFADTWKLHRPSLDHTLYVVMNGGEASLNDFRPFDGIPCQRVTYSNLGWDVGAYQQAAETIPCDLLVCLGAPVHFHWNGWLERMVDAYVDNGPALYGCWAYAQPRHVRTTAFWCPPQLLNSYPYSIGSSRQSRYDFEHGKHSFTSHVLQSGFDCLMVTRTGCFRHPQWPDHVPGVDNSLLMDQFTYDPNLSNLPVRQR